MSYSFETGLYIYIAAFAADILSGIIPEYSRRIHHLLGIPSVIAGFFSAGLNRPQRTEGVLRFRGILYFAFVAIVCFIAGTATVGLAAFTDYGMYIEVFLISTVIGAGAVIFPPSGVKKKNGNVEEKLAALRISAETVAKEKDYFGVCRLYIEEVSVIYLNTVFYGFCFLVPAAAGHNGIPYLFVAVGINEAVSRFRFGKTPLTPFSDILFLFYRIIAFVPSVTACVLIWVAAACVPHASPAGSAVTVFKYAGNHRLAPMGRMYASFSGALNITLGGRVFDGVWIGKDGSSAKSGYEATVKARILYFVGISIFVAAVSAILLHKTAGLL